MAIKIKYTSDCPYRDNIMDKYFCNHPSMDKRYCHWTAYFPPDCPIQTDLLRKEKINKILKK